MSAGRSGFSAGRMKKGPRLWQVIPLVLLLLGLAAHQAFAVQCDGEDCEIPGDLFTSSTQSTRGLENELGSPSGGVVYNGVPLECPTVFEEQALLLINVERARVGLDPLELDTRLQAAGRWFANDLALNGITNIGNPHEDSDGHDPGYRLTAQGYTWTSYGETIALGTEDFADTPEEAVQGWMSSPPHKAILLGSYEHVGIGHKFLEEYPSTGEWENAWVADFANTAGARSAPPANCDPGYHENFFPFVGK